MTILEHIRLLEAQTRTRSFDPSKGLHGWRKSAIDTRKALALLNEKIGAENARIAERYSPTVAEQKIAENNSFMREAVRTAKEALRRELESTITAKKESLKRANKAPSAEDLRLLQALSLRTNLSPNDISRAAESMANNLPSLQTLADIAQKHGIPYRAPSADSLEESLAEAQRLAEGMISDLTTDSAKLTYDRVAFYEYPDSNVGRFPTLAEQLDGDAFATAEPISNRLDTSAISRAKGVQITIADGDSLANICMQFAVRYADLEKANPGKDLTALHEGDLLIVPSGRMRIMHGHGFVSADRVAPAYDSADPRFPEIQRSTGQRDTATKASLKTEGETVAIGG